MRTDLMKHPIRRVRGCNWENKFLNANRFDVTPDFEEQGLHLGQTVGIDEFPVIEPQTSPEVVHEHRKAGHDSKHAPWTTELITTTRCETAGRTSKESSNIRVVLIEFFVPPLTLVGDFYEVLGFG